MRICILPAGTGGVFFYRIKQPYGYLKDKGFCDIFIFDQDSHDFGRLKMEQDFSDICLFQCPWSEGIRDAIKLIKYKNSRSLRKSKIVIEMDDNLFNVSPWNEKYNVFGLEEYSITYWDQESADRMILAKIPWQRYKKNKNGTMTFDIWRDGYAGFDIKANQLRYKATQESLQIADLLTVTTKELGKQLRKYRPKGPIAVLPNLIDSERWLPMKKSNTKEIRIGWQGGSAHFADLYLIANQLKEIAKKYENVKLCFMGIQYDALFGDIKDQIEWHPWHGDINTYPLVVRDLRLDIGLCPLEDTIFNRGKSPLKWLEYSLLKIPTIASPIVYGDYIDYGKTGFISKDNEWVKYLEILINSKELRENMAQKAYDRVIRKYSIDQSKMYLDVMKDLLNIPKLILKAA